VGTPGHGFVRRSLSLRPAANISGTPLTRGCLDRARLSHEPTPNGWVLERSWSSERAHWTAATAPEGIDVGGATDEPFQRPNGRMIMANKDRNKGNVKKVGKTLKEKRSAKKAKAANTGASHIPSTGH
jgi:hypothetical protein